MCRLKKTDESAGPVFSYLPPVLADHRIRARAIWALCEELDHTPSRPGRHGGFGRITSWAVCDWYYFLSLSGNILIYIIYCHTYQSPHPRSTFPPSTTIPCRTSPPPPSPHLICPYLQHLRPPVMGGLWVDIAGIFEGVNAWVWILWPHRTPRD